MKTLKVLLLDDVKATNYIHTKFLRQTLGQVEVQSFQKGQEALDYLEGLEPSDFPQLFFVDINMPSMSAWAFFDKWLERSLPVPEHCHIYILTTSITPADQVRMQNFEFLKDIIYKPLHSLIIQKLYRIYAEESGFRLALHTDIVGEGRER